MAYYAGSVFLSAFLLFQLQPLIGKYILPWFGGTPAVWSTSMLFFQVLLTGGYAYAYWLAGRPVPRRQGIIHLAVLALSLALLVVLGLSWSSPITPGMGWRPAGANQPTWNVFRILAAAVGLPYFILSTNSVLMQAWFSRDFSARSPYRLYALSNAGSLLALVTYPFLIEPLLALQTQARAWSWGYLGFALLAGYGALRALRAAPAVGNGPSAPEKASAAGEPRPGLVSRILWVALPTCASVMLLATTNQICQEVAVIPFLWVLPLTLYLLTFILCFSSSRWYSHKGYMIALVVSGILFCWVFFRSSFLNILLQIATHCLTLFVCCMVCHGELVRLRPSPRYLTSFYLLISVGGAIGGVIVNLVAPHIFTGYAELPLGFLGCGLMLVVTSLVNRPSSQARRFRRLLAILLAGTVVLLAILFLVLPGGRPTGVVEASRNFYGILRVREINASVPDERAFQMTHGTTVHGVQFAEAAKRRLPTAYYTEQSGIGLAILHHPKRGTGMRIGVLGLGAGTLACYGQPGDTIRFYEINPQVIRLAEGAGGYFTYLQDSRAQVEVVLGDARISLERELRTGQPQRYDLLVLDVFSSDSIPVHLLTVESFAIYLQHLQPDGVLALHITNQYLDLVPVARRLADHFDLRSVLIRTPPDGDRAYGSTWMLVSRSDAFLQQPAIADRSSPRLQESRPVRLWTDDYSNLFRILKY